MVILDMIKKRLRITWDDADEDLRLQNLISSGQQYLNEIAGTDIDYEVDLFAFELLYVYILYSRNDSLASYRKEYQQDFTRLRLKYSAKKAVLDNEAE